MKDLHFYVILTFLSAAVCLQGSVSKTHFGFTPTCDVTSEMPSLLLTFSRRRINSENDGMSSNRWRKMYLRVRKGPFDRWQGWNTLKGRVGTPHPLHDRDVKVGARKTFHSICIWHRTDLKLMYNFLILHGQWGAHYMQ